MKKNYYLLLLVLMLSANAKAQTNWVTKNLDEKVSVKFPAEPQKMTRNGVDVYIVKASDSMAYSAGVIDFQVAAHLDSAALAPMQDTQEFANEMKTGIASTKTNYTFGDVSVGK